MTDMLKVHNPYDQSVVAEIPMNSHAEVEAALALSHRLEREGPLPKTQRLAVLEVWAVWAS